MPDHNNNDKQNQRIAIAALIAVVVLCCAALVLSVHLLQNAEFSFSFTDLRFDLLPERLPKSVPEVLAPKSIVLGQYEGEPIEWIVLDRQDDRMLVLSRRALEELPFHEVHEPVTWESSTIRAWLNGVFLSSAFTEEEASRILMTENDNSSVNPDYHYTEGSGPTEDRIFLLSHDELIRYLPAEEDRICEKPLHAPSYENEHSAWWLRSPGLWPTDTEYVSRGGPPLCMMADGMYIHARPAMWIKN